MTLLSLLFLLSLSFSLKCLWGTITHVAGPLPVVLWLFHQSRAFGGHAVVSEDATIPPSHFLLLNYLRETLNCHSGYRPVNFHLADLG